MKQVQHEDLSVISPRQCLLSEVSTDGRHHVQYLLIDQAPPLEYVTSVRSLVFKDESILILRNREQQMHILPGGHREDGESYEQTLCREVLEETGWTLSSISLIGCIHVVHRKKTPSEYRGPYPHSLNLVYASYAVDYVPKSMAPNDYEEEAFFHPLADIGAYSIREAERCFLNAVIDNGLSS